MKHLTLAVGLALVMLLHPVSVSAAGGGSPCGQGWYVCRSLTCTYAIKWSGVKKTAWLGVRVNTATVTLSKGKWMTVTCK